MRWLLFVPAGLFEILLAVCAGVLVTIIFMCSVILAIAYKLPGLEWYLGGDYKRKNIFDIKVKI
jgi:hypothetical protein